MNHYSTERKTIALKKLLPPNNQSVREVSETEGISEATLYNWRTKAKQQGYPVPGSGKTSDTWSAETRLMQGWGWGHLLTPKNARVCGVRL